MINVLIKFAKIRAQIEGALPKNATSERTECVVDLRLSTVTSRNTEKQRGGIKVPACTATDNRNDYVAMNFEHYFSHKPSRRVVVVV